MSVCEPFALFVGPTKSGTTWVQAYLESRGDVALPRDMKETFFFDKRYDRGFDWYESLFPDDADPRLRVEVAPSLAHKPYACERVRRHVPAAKIIFIVRNPMDRAVSHYFHYRIRGEPEVSLKEMAKRYPDVIDAGMYAQNATFWEEAFGSDRVHFLSYDQLRENPDGFCRGLCDVLDIEFIAPNPDLSARKVNTAKVPRNLFAARMAQLVTTKLRNVGAKNLVSVFKHTPLKRWLYSGGAHFEVERERIKEQSVSISETLRKDWTAFQTHMATPEQTDASTARHADQASV